MAADDIDAKTLNHMMLERMEKKPEAALEAARNFLRKLLIRLGGSLVLPIVVFAKTGDRIDLQLGVANFDTEKAARHIKTWSEAELMAEERPMTALLEDELRAAVAKAA